jgi:hypothetical protein
MTFNIKTSDSIYSTAAAGIYHINAACKTTGILWLTFLAHNKEANKCATDFQVYFFCDEDHTEVYLQYGYLPCQGFSNSFVCVSESSWICWDPFSQMFYPTCSLVYVALINIRDRIHKGLPPPPNLPDPSYETLHSVNANTRSSFI